ncbi:MAG: aromatic ring-hydroxylating dioxygenase subunit alpha [Pseudomonadota bacterium]
MTATIHDFLSRAQLDRVLGRDGLPCRLPRAAYLERDFLALEYRAWLARSWLVVARVHEIRNPGDLLPVPGHPFFLAHGRDGEIRAFHNACRHRGHELVAKPCDGLRRITCPYHSWSYDLDGRLLAAPHFGGSGTNGHPGLDKAAFGLKPLRTGRWHNWILINIDGRAEPLEDFVRPMAARFHDVDFSRLDHFSTVKRHPLPVNWKIAMENNVEPYHVPVVHAETAAGQALADHIIVDDGPLVGCAIDIPGRPFTNRPEVKTNDSLDTSARFILRTPNLYFTSHAPDKIVDSLILPDSEDPGRCWVSHACYSTSGEAMAPDQLALWHQLEEQVLVEDEAVMAGVTRGLRSVVTEDGGILSPAWEGCISGFYRNMLSAMIGDASATS